MKKTRIIIMILLFIFLTSLELGIIIEAIAHVWAGFGAGNIMEYNEAGNIGISCLIFFIPISIFLMLLIRIVLCIKKHTIKELLLDCICALCGIGITIGIIHIFSMILPYRDNPILLLGRLIAAFIIDSFDWIDYVIP